MDAAVRELLDLALRWVHVIAAIMWIGNSLLFNWLDRNLRRDGNADPASRGRIWLLHSGGFYDVEKTLSPGRELPRPLHWFKWQAYTTWLSGAALLVVVYYMSGGALLVAPDAGLGRAAATAVAIGALAGGWLVYELLWRSPIAGRPELAAMLSFALLLAAGHGLGQVLTGRAAFLHIGALLGTIMAANVLLRIMPAQRQMVRAIARGEPPDARLSDQAKLRSIHNNYMTFPVIILMLGSHFPSFHGHHRGWLVLGVIVLAGAGVRHALNIRFAYRRWAAALGATAVAGMATLYVLGARPAAYTAAGAGPLGQGAASTGGEPAPSGSALGPPSFEAAAAVVRKRCTVCHSASPADRSFGPAPGGVAFDSPEQIRALATRIEARAILTRTMPPGNSTWMTEPERELLGRWARAAANAR